MNVPANISELRNGGFEGFISVSALQRKDIPDVAGVYVVVRDTDITPKFLEIGTGGHFKGKNPNVSVSTLEQKWVLGERIVYFGKAGGKGSASTLRRRIGAYLAFGRGKPVGHRGGCYIWQLVDSSELLICWKATLDEEPRTVEATLIAGFKQRTKRWPFANRSD